MNAQSASVVDRLTDLAVQAEKTRVEDIRRAESMFTVRLARRGLYSLPGRPHLLSEQDRQGVRDMRSQGMRATDIAQATGVSKATVYRILADR